MTWQRAAVLMTMGLLGCAGMEGPPGPQGPEGDQGPPGPSSSGGGGRIVWKDASGSVVARDLPLYVDARGLIWSLEVETARLPAVTPLPLYYVSADCSGASYVGAVGPRTAFKVAGEGEWRVRPDTLQSETRQLASTRASASGPCLPFAVSLRTLPLADMPVPSPAVQEPSLPFVPPLRMEREG